MPNAFNGGWSFLVSLSRMVYFHASIESSFLFSGKGKRGLTSRSSVDEQLSSYFDKGNKVAVIKNIDHMDIEVAKIFYRYVKGDF